MNIVARDIRRSKIDTSHIEIRLATHDDVPELARLFGVFFAQSQWPHFLTFNQEKAELRLCELLARKTTPHLVAFDEGKMVACISWHYDLQYTDEPIGVMDETFVLEPYRRTNLGIKMVALALHLARGDNCPVFNFPLASGLPETKSYVNMLRKFGGEICGVIVRVVQPVEAGDGR
jgi:hypothetical protein